MSTGVTKQTAAGVGFTEGLSGRSSAVERYLAKVEVESSILFARSTLRKRNAAKAASPECKTGRLFNRWGLAKSCLIRYTLLSFREV